MRVASLLPSATELICAVGAEDGLVGRSHECDYPEGIKNRPILTAAINPFESCRQMNDAVNASLEKGEGLYTVDTELMQRLKPDVIVTQSLCTVCSVDLRLVEKLCGRMTPRPIIVSLDPRTLEEVLDDLLRVGDALQLGDSARAARQQLQSRVDAVTSFVATQPAVQLRKVALLEWFDPIFPGGHWTPQLVHMAGGCHPINPIRDNGAAPASAAVTNEQFAASDPDWIIVCPCGLDIEETKKELPGIIFTEWWKGLRAVKEGRVVLVDGNQMFSRPGPRLVDALEFLAGLLHGREDLIPEGFPWEMWVQPDVMPEVVPATSKTPEE